MIRPEIIDCCSALDPCVLRARELSFGHTTTLGTLDGLELHRGQAVAVVGPNGAGKSALLQTFAGQLDRCGGELDLQGADPRRLPAHERARRVALLGQGLAPDLELTVYELVALGRTPHLGRWGTPRAADRAAIDEALARCALEQLASRPLGQLSGGERQRALIAMTVAQQAPLLLLDEPGAYLDLHWRYELFALLAELRAEGLFATVLVVHELTDAEREAERQLLVAPAGVCWLPDDAEKRREAFAKALHIPVDRVR